MIEREDIKKLARLARIKVTEEEIGSLHRDIGSILRYVSEIEKVETKKSVRGDVGPCNVMRRDGNPHEPREYTDELLKAAASREGDYIRVKNVL